MSDLRHRDLALHSAGLTFYAGIAVVPSLLVALRLASWLVGEADVLRLADSLAAALPDALGAPDVAREAVRAGAVLPLLGFVFALLPASLYGEGLRRAFVSMAREDEAMTGWRGRLRVVPLFVVTPLLVLALLLITPTLADLFDGGSVAAGALGVYISLNVDWLVLWVALAYAYAVVGPLSPSWRALMWGAGTTAAFISGFVQGFVLFLALPIDLGAPFGGLTAVGAVVAVGFWLWLLHLLVLVGYLATQQLDARGGRPFRRLAA